MCITCRCVCETELLYLCMTTNEAFKTLVDQRGWFSKVEGMNENTARTIRKRFADGGLTIDKMEELLVKAGFKVIQEKQWAYLADVELDEEGLLPLVNLIDRPLTFWDDFTVWKDLHSHMFKPHWTGSYLLQLYDMYNLKFEEHNKKQA